ncbi:CpXC domain-containing protein [Eubacteriales bacterium OttesenSCG-928-K08]|nr:CpXC domain-containing protein [Eubacteriales bacterium OttesenSCG-928-K08]
MSRQRTAMITCPTCGTSFETRYWESLNAEMNPAEKEQLLSGKLFYTTCPNCHAQHQFVYPMLYHDMTHKLMVWLLFEEEQIRVLLHEMDGVRTSSLMISQTGYHYRFVRSINELREKAMIFAYGLDDRVIEVLKLFQRSIIHKKLPHVKVNRTMFFPGSPHQLIIFAGDGATYTTELIMDPYEEIAQTRKNRMDERSRGCVCIDEKWAFDLLQNYGVYNKNLPLMYVHYGNEYMGFSDGTDKSMCLCSC